MKRERGGILVNLVVLLFLIVLAVVLYLARHPIMRFAAEQWVVEDQIEKASAIIVLGGDNFYADRATRATELYRQGYAPVVVASGPKLRPFAGTAELTQKDLIDRGVPKENVMVFSHDADSTLEEAVALAGLAQKEGWKRVIVVTSNYHTRRSRYIFRKIFPASVQVEVASARDLDFDPQNWYSHRKSAKLFVHELAGMAAAIWELRKRDDSTRVGSNGSGDATQSVGYRLEGQTQLEVYVFTQHPIFAVRGSALHTVSPVLSSIF